MMMEVGYKKHSRTNHAQYHAICRILFNNTKLQRAQKRKRPTGDGDESNSSSSDGKLLAKLSAGDVVAQELKYPLLAYLLCTTVNEPICMS